MEKLKALVRLEESLIKLPSVGRRSAERMAYALLNMVEDDLLEFAAALTNLKKAIKTCPTCGFLTETEQCAICEDRDRDNTVLMVVSFPKDVIALEKAETYRGLYHVLNGVISLSKGVSVSDLNIDSLIKRLSKNDFKEVIIATQPTIEGETTALYLAKTLAGKVEAVTRLAYGLPMGGNLDYTDALTLSKAVEGRRKL
ncbi:MAG: recombination protein RecR [Erysipelotrichia bacterium]|nr:recombination protein RecR [Erysipelotrichia bacterium]